MRLLIMLMFLSTAMLSSVFSSAALSKEEGGTKFALEHDQLTFNYQELNSPWSNYSCKHEEDGPVDWKVYCLVDGKVAQFGVHLLVNRYERTHYGLGSYEVLYWVTDRTMPNRRDYDSTTLWIHNSMAENSVRRFEIGQGVLNDMVSLRLIITL